MNLISIYHWLSNINFKFFRDKVILSYGLLSLILSGLSLLGWWFLYQNTMRKYENSLDNIVPIHYYAIQLENITNQSTNTLQSYLLTKNIYYKQERKSYWQNTYRSTIDSLMDYTLSWKKDRVIALVYDIKIKMNRLKAEQNHLENSTLSPQELKEAIKSLQLLHNDIHSALQLLINIQKEEIHLIKTSVQFDVDNLKLFYVPSVVILIVIASMLLGWLVVRPFLERIKKIQYSLELIDSGNFPENLPEGNDELVIIVNKLNTLIRDLKHLKEFAQQVGNKNFNAKLPTLNPLGEFGHAFIDMRDRLKQISLQEAQNSWVNKGIAYFSTLLRSHDTNLDLLCETFTRSLIDYLKTFKSKKVNIANQVGVYLVEGSMLNLVSCYAYDVKKMEKKEIPISEGVLGEAVQEKRTMCLENLPDDYINISSGLGNASPRSLLIVPMLVANSVEGVIEIASFHKFDAYEIELIEKVCQIMASMIISVRASSQTKRLLEESRIQSAKLRTQGEEMRQHIEELRASEDKMKDQERQLQQALASQKDAQNQLVTCTKELEEFKKELDLQVLEVQEVRVTERKRAEMKIEAQKLLLNKLVKRNKELEEELKNHYK